MRFGRRKQRRRRGKRQNHWKKSKTCSSTRNQLRLWSWPDLSGQKRFQQRGEFDRRQSRRELFSPKPTGFLSQQAARGGQGLHQHQQDQRRQLCPSSSSSHL